MSVSKSKIPYILIVILVLIFAVGVFYMYGVFTKYDNGSVNTEKKVIQSSIDYVEKNDKYQVGVCQYTVAYPEFLPLEGVSHHEELNTYVQKTLRNMLDESSYDCESQGDIFAGYKEDMTYKISFNKAGVVSMLLESSYSAAGAAHPGVKRRALNYDFSNNRILDEATLFDASKNYRSDIDKKVADALSTEVNVPVIDATLPSSYEFYISEDGLHIINLFDMYALAFFEVNLSAQDMQMYLSNDYANIF